MTTNDTSIVQVLRNPNITYPNFSGIVRGLKDSIDSLARESMATKFGYPFTDKRYIREFRTLGFTSPRQVGKSKWCVEEVVDQPNTVLVVMSQMLRLDLLQRCSAEARTSVEDRILTMKDVLTIMGDRGAMPDNPVHRMFRLPCVIDQIIVDDATFFFNKMRPNKFFKWAADVFDRNSIESPYVVLVG